jgi:UDP-glucose 4-epimerase
MKILITGGLGRVGSMVSARLQTSHEVVILDAAEPGSRELGEASYFRGSVSDAEAVTQAMHGVDAVVHLAALFKYFPERHRDFVEVNYRGTFNVLEAAVKCGVGKVILASSICAYGFIFWARKQIPEYFPIDEEHPTHPNDLYGLTKLQGEQLCRAYAERYGLQAVALRLATVWFPADLDHTRRYFEWLKNPELAINHIWNYVDARDVAQAVDLALAYEGPPFDVFNIGADEVAARVDSMELVRRYYPGVPAIKNTGEFLLRPRAALFGNTNAKDVLGFCPHFTWRDYPVDD